ncbi:MAG TPA: type VI secretion system accessory protein TagJ [Gemmataceae bacterium]|nr:type VI secretion system accessory protein TagJ [Gemmataceae bacterium]
MNASELFKAGKLSGAIAAQVQEVKAHPTDHGRHLFLFELLAFSGDLERARKQIEAIHYDEMVLESARLAYRQLLDAEQSRRRVIHDGIMPQFLVPPPEHLYKRLEAINCLRADKQAEASALLMQAEEEAPPLKGTLNGRTFEGLRDCDDLFGPVLEVMAHGDYFWLPVEQVESLSAKPPKSPRDLLWLPAKLSVREGPAGDVFLPVLYPGSHEHAEELVKIGRATDWKQLDGGPVRGAGARTFLVGDEGVNLLEWRDLCL